jgi:hypothetical protein
MDPPTKKGSEGADAGPRVRSREAQIHDRDLLDLCKRNLASIKKEAAAGAVVDPSILAEMETNIAMLEIKEKSYGRR